MLEDEEDVRQTLCEQLHQLGWLTLETASGEEALQLLEASPDIALLISDLMLPGALSGADVIHTARRRFPALPVLLISGRDLRPAQNPALPEVEWLRKAVYPRPAGAGAEARRTRGFEIPPLPGFHADD